MEVEHGGALREWRPGRRAVREEPRARLRADGRQARRGPGDQDGVGRRGGRDQLERAARPGRQDRRRARLARRPQGRHGGDHAQQPARVLRPRHGCGLARRGPVLDLPDVLAGADPVRGLGRRGAGRGGRVVLPRGLLEGARGPAAARDPGRDRRRRRRPHARVAGGDRPRLRPLRDDRGGRARTTC